MSRKIKFRFYDKFDETMLSWEDALMSDCEDAFIVATALENFDNESLFAMQFTGLHDKNGVEIFDGDLLLIGGDSYCLNYDDEDIIEVKWYDGLAGWTPFCDDHSDFNGLTADRHTEIIGNIHNNPEFKTLGYIYGFEPQEVKP